MKGVNRLDEIAGEEDDRPVEEEEEEDSDSYHDEDDNEQSEDPELLRNHPDLQSKYVRVLEQNFQQQQIIRKMKDEDLQHRNKIRKLEARVKEFEIKKAASKGSKPAGTGKAGASAVKTQNSNGEKRKRDVGGTLTNGRASSTKPSIKRGKKTDVDGKPQDALKTTPSPSESFSARAAKAVAACEAPQSSTTAVSQPADDLVTQGATGPVGGPSADAEDENLKAYPDLIRTRFPDFVNPTDGSVSSLTKTFLKAHGADHSPICASGARNRMTMAIPKQLWAAYMSEYETRFGKKVPASGTLPQEAPPMDKGEKGKKRKSPPTTQEGSASASSAFAIVIDPEVKKQQKSLPKVAQESGSSSTAGANTASSADSEFTVKYILPGTTRTATTKLTPWTQLIRSRYPMDLDAFHAAIRKIVVGFLEAKLPNYSLAFEKCLVSPGRGRKAPGIPGVLEDAFWKVYEAWRETTELSDVHEDEQNETVSVDKSVNKGGVANPAAKEKKAVKAKPLPMKMRVPSDMPVPSIGPPATPETVDDEDEDEQDSDGQDLLPAGSSVLKTSAASKQKPSIRSPASQSAVAKPRASQVDEDELEDLEINTQASFHRPTPSTGRSSSSTTKDIMASGLEQRPFYNEDARSSRSSTPSPQRFTDPAAELTFTPVVAWSDKTRYPLDRFPTHWHAAIKRLDPEFDGRPSVHRKITRQRIRAWINQYVPLDRLADCMLFKADQSSFSWAVPLWLWETFATWAVDEHGLPECFE
ncbi:hypothetical protein HKX48_000248 [Thoreauomyces humboldtii]|nr:hypothetical protein HKX48_000248 [Thoreauomyces humboldtii]